MFYLLFKVGFQFAGKLFLRAMFCVVFHSCVRLSFVSGNESVLLM
jgi:hypothetical protein